MYAATEYSSSSGTGVFKSRQCSKYARGQRLAVGLHHNCSPGTIKSVIIFPLGALLHDTTSIGGKRLFSDCYHICNRRIMTLPIRFPTWHDT